ncbi:MAG: hypothetical protein IJT94_11115, partial [Oscillibacter sp.]|nr:hypothetical protein [Oscillibacter sp.]
KPALSVYLKGVALGHGLDERLALHASERLSQYSGLSDLAAALLRESVAAQCMEPGTEKEER